MQNLNLPPCQFKFKMLGQITQIFDIVRKKYTTLTPEEWVRQHIIHYLIFEKKYPISLIGVEKGIVFNGLKKRVDILVFDQNANPFMIVECKAPEIAISQDVFDQISIYNLHLKVPVLLITNGINHYCYSIDNQNSKFQFLNEIPNYPPYL